MKIFFKIITALSLILVLVLHPASVFAQTTPTPQESFIPTPTPTEFFSPVPTPTESGDPQATPTPCVIFVDNEEPVPCPTEEPTPDPTATPLSCTGTQHANADNSQCVDFDIPGGGSNGGGTTSTGQVLGASTLADTGSNNSTMGLILMVLGLTLTASSSYVFAKRAVK